MANKTAIGNHQQQPPQQAGGSAKPASSIKQGNVLPLWGNEKTMNLNPLILTNILSSPYFKVQLYELKTYHEVVDEIYFKVTHIEPWEKGSRKTAGQTGMCGGVRGVGTGGIVSTAFCLLYKLFTLKLTRKQVMGLITHTDSPYIRGLGFMYIRYTQPPADLWDWYEPFLDDEEELDVKAGGGCVMTIGEMIRSFLTKLEWFSTLFPRIPVPVQKNLDQYLKTRPRKITKKDGKDAMEDHERLSERRHSRSPRRSLSPRKSRSRSRHREGHGSFGFDKELERERERQKREREQMKDRERSEKDRHKSRSSDRGMDRRRSRSRDRHRSRSRDKRNDKKDKEREKENERSRRRDKDYDKERVSDRDRDRNIEKELERSRDRDKRSRSKTEERKRKEERREKDERRHKDDKKDSKKDKKHSRSRSREKRHRSSSPGRGHVSKRSRSKSKEKSKHRNEHKEKSNKRSVSRERTDENDSERLKKQSSHSKERAHKRSRSKERSHKQSHSDGKDHSSKLSHRSLSAERENKSNAEGWLQGNTTDDD
ncbi:pre-mRNA-splicing factor 38B [Mobula hypostoma]|uniref:pre-mRNA-splicing factor 38B n=1 Tax=Mobula hypostoma TaxID=723540 RepID=UPI002FC2CF02